MPRTPNRVITELAPSERVAIYDYVVEKSKNCVNREEITIEQLEEFGSIHTKEKGQCVSYIKTELPFHLSKTFFWRSD